jgi:hypothetical protein
VGAAGTVTASAVAERRAGKRERALVLVVVAVDTQAGMVDMRAGMVGKRAVVARLVSWAVGGLWPRCGTWRSCR